MLVRIVAVFLLLFVGACSPRIIGTWQSDDGRRYAEIQFCEDHSFVLLNRPSTTGDELVALTELQKEFGTWRAEGNRLKIDCTNRSSHERTQARVTFSLVGGLLKMQNIFDPSLTETYNRLDLPTCVDASAVTRQSFGEGDITGKWRVHYHTHDLELVFEPSHRVALTGEGSKLYEDSNWHLADQTLTINTPREGQPNKMTWTLIGKGTNCLTFTDDWPMVWTLHRLE
jgi:hypothetical protein